MKLPRLGAVNRGMICTKCNVDKPADLDHFRGKRKTANGYISSHGLCQPCRECHNKLNREYAHRPENRERRLAKHKKDYRENPEIKETRLRKKKVNDIDPLSDSYMKHRLRARGLSEINGDLINTQRIYILCRRTLSTINNLKNESN